MENKIKSKFICSYENEYDVGLRYVAFTNLFIETVLIIPISVYLKLIADMKISPNNDKIYSESVNFYFLYLNSNSSNYW